MAVVIPPNNRDKFDRDRSRNIVQPPPPFPRLPEAFVSRYEPEIQEALNLYSRQCQDWVQKYVTGQT